jgi:hypothetical protein
MLQSGRYIRIIGVVFLFLIIVGYAGIKSINLVQGPELTVTSPKNGEVVHDPLLTIEGEAQNVTFLTLNDRQIFVDDQGRLADQLLLYEGYNIITVKAKDRFGREKTIPLEVIYKP